MKVLHLGGPLSGQRVEVGALTDKRQAYQPQYVALNDPPGDPLALSMKMEIVTYSLHRVDDGMGHRQFVYALDSDYNKLLSEYLAMLSRGFMGG